MLLNLFKSKINVLVPWTALFFLSLPGAGGVPVVSLLQTCQVDEA